MRCVVSSRDAEFNISPLDLSNEAEMEFLFETRRHPLVASFLLGTPPSDMQAHRSWVAGNVPAKRRMYVARMDGRMVGYCHAYGFDVERPYVEVGFAVHPDWQGMGVGGRMVEWIVGEVKRVFPGRTVMLMVKSDNERACRLYERKGFVCVNGGDVAMYVHG